MAVATAATNGGGGWVRWLRARERTEEGDELEGVSERDQGAAWRPQASLEGAGEEAGSGQGRARARATRLCPSGEEEDDRGGGGGGLGRNGSWAGSAAGERQVSGWASLFYFCFYLFILFCVVLV